MRKSSSIRDRIFWGGLFRISVLLCFFGLVVIALSLYQICVLSSISMVNIGSHFTHMQLSAKNRCNSVLYDGLVVRLGDTQMG